MRICGSRLRTALVVLFLVLVVLPGLAVAAGCTYENCWFCRTEGYFNVETFCTPVNGQGGRLCCSEYPDGQGGTECRVFDYYCYGIIILDV